jgi:hypothetical protein
VPPTPLTATVRYVPAGLRKIYWVTTIATYTAPTRGELNAGIDLSNEVAEINGFSVASTTVDTPDLSSRFVSKIPGPITADNSSLSFYASSTSSDVRTVLPRDTSGFVVFLWEGDTTGLRMDVFPAKVTSSALDGNMTDPEKVNISFAITRVPASNVVIP